MRKNACCSWLAVLVWTSPWLASSLGAASPEITASAGPHHRAHAVPGGQALRPGASHASVPAVVQLEAGLQRWENGRWVETEETIELLGRQPVARRTAHRVIWAANANTRAAVDMEMPDGGRLRSHCLGLGYYDAASGRSVLIAELKDCQAQVHPPNLLVYPDAFDDVPADLVYVNRRSGLEQFVILHASPPGPEIFGMDPQSTRLEVITEFLEGPRPKLSRRVVRGEAHPGRRAAMAEPDSTDDTLDFGTMMMGSGRAFLAQGAVGLVPPEDSFPMLKRWEEVEGRQVLFESLDYAGLSHLLAGSKPSARPVRIARQAVPAAHRTLPARTESSRQVEPVLLAAGTQWPAGVVLDYSINATILNAVFKGDTTYYLTGPAVLAGTNATFEAGTVLKFASTNSARIDLVCSNVTWLATPWRPVVLTASDDASVGIPLTAQEPVGYYGDFGLRFPNPGCNISLSHLRVSHTRTALFLPSSGTATVRHAQFVNCQTAVRTTGASLAMGNVLMANVATNFDLGTALARVEHLTVDQAACLNTGPGLFLTNSLLVAVASAQSWIGEANASAPTATGVFQAAGAGSHYLPLGSPFRNAGTFAIQASLRTDLRRLTTMAPAVLSEPMSLPTVLRPRVDGDGDQLDLGYHYPTLDYLASNLVLKAALTLSNGVSVGLCGSTGFYLENGASLRSEGTPLMPNRLTGANVVQEQPTALGQSCGVKVTSPQPTGSIRFRFTEFSLLAGAAGSLLEAGQNPIAEVQLRDCVLRCAQFNLATGGSATTSVSLTNNLLERCLVSVSRAASNLTTPLQVALVNNLFAGGLLNLSYALGANNPVWLVQNNLFDGSTQTLGGDGAGAMVARDHNGFTAGTTNGLAGTFNKQNLARDFQAGTLGGYYYPSTGAGLSQLRNAGSSADAGQLGLYHYTTTVDQAKEANTSVDIGFHYVALDAAGRTADTDGDGSADYFEDSNGNGLAETWESNWLIPASGGTGLVRLVVFTPLQ